MASQAKERRILRAAERLFTKRRFHEVTMDDIRTEAGVGKGTIYRYFKDKDDLFVRVAVSGFDELCGLLERTASADLEFEEQLARVLSAIRRFFRRRRALFRVMHSEQTRLAFNHSAIRARWMERRRELVRRVADVLRGGAAAGAVRRDIPPGTLAACLLGLLRGAVMAPVVGAGKRPSVAVVINLFLRGAAPGHESMRRGP